MDNPQEWATEFRNFQNSKECYALGYGKRAVDVVVACLLLVVLSPLFLAISLAVLVGSPGPVIYRQERIGLRGRTFQILKFRTMTHHHYPGMPVLGATPNYKLFRDPRVTPVGRILRSWSLDELPQLFNVLRRDMSLVGPRPVTGTEMENFYRENAAVVTSVRPGMTGLWQVSGRSILEYSARIRLDIRYVETASFALDLVIAVKTVAAVLRRVGAY